MGLLTNLQHYCLIDHLSDLQIYVIPYINIIFYLYWNTEDDIWLSFYLCITVLFCKVHHQNVNFIHVSKFPSHFFLPDHEGKAGMASLILKQNTSLDLEQIYKQVVTYLPSYACPLFLRVQVSCIIAQRTWTSTSSEHRDG